jgi:hypothetical protein
MLASPGKYLLAVLTFGLVACSGFPSTHPNAAKNNAATYKVDLQDCKLAYPETPDGVYLKQRIACLKLKGWE